LDRQRRPFLEAVSPRRSARKVHRLPLRRQKLPLEVHPHGQLPLLGLAMASCAPCDGTQNDPDDVYPCGQLPPGPDGFGTGKG
jgi:hypothetical protein